MTNDAIADNFSLLGKLMDIHRENSFKAKSYTSAAFTIEKLTGQLSELPREKIYSIKGIGESIGNNIIEQLESGQLTILNEYLNKTPPGILEMLSIKGIGPKKIATIWHELSIETLGELLYACEENRLTLYKGFGNKTQQSIKESILFYIGTQGNYLYQQIEFFAVNVEAKLKAIFNNTQFYITGSFKRQLEIIEQLDWVTTVEQQTLKSFFLRNGYQLVGEDDHHVVFVGQENVKLGFYCVAPDSLVKQLFVTSCSQEFLEEWQSFTNNNAFTNFENEQLIFSSNQLPFIPAYLRETGDIITSSSKGNIPEVITTSDIKGIIHCHSSWSDGNNTLEEMVIAAIEKGYEYLVISDHSKSAFYAQGLSVERVLAQHQQIDELNTRYAPFKIYKSIESDILNDGSLDYEDEILKRFDLVIASIHSNLKMPFEKAMSRLLKAIENPYTAILGHMTGRLLLSRNGYPINHLQIIDACAANNVVIELNAHPRRLDIDWRWIKPAIDKGVLLSINPDAHSIEGYSDCRFGILVAQKAGFTASNNLSSFTFNEFENFLAKQKLKHTSSERFF